MYKGVEHTVTVWPTPDVDFVWDDACLQSVGTLTEQVFIDSAYTITGLEWTYPDGTGSTGSFGAYYFDTAGAYPVTLVATSNKGCMDSITNQVVVYPKVVADVFRDSTICEGDTIQLLPGTVNTINGHPTTTSVICWIMILLCIRMFLPPIRS